MPVMTATVSDPDGVRVIVVSAQSQRALDAAVKDVLLYRRALLIGTVLTPSNA